MTRNSVFEVEITNWDAIGNICVEFRFGAKPTRMMRRSERTEREAFHEAKRLPTTSAIFSMVSADIGPRSRKR